MQIQYIFLIGFIAALIVELSLYRYLKNHHPQLYIELGSPKFGDSNIGGSAWKLQKFIWSFRFLKLNDIRINVYCFIAIIFGIAWIASFLFVE